MFWRKKKSDDPVSEAIEFFNTSFQTVVACKEGFVRNGLQAEFTSVQHAGAIFLVWSSNLNIAGNPANIPKLIEGFVASATSFLDACDKLAAHPSSSDDVRTMVDALKRTAGNVVAVVREEYKGTE